VHGEIVAYDERRPSLNSFVYPIAPDFVHRHAKVNSGERPVHRHPLHGRHTKMLIHHVPAHTMWAHIFEDGEMGEVDKTHITNCPQCLDAFHVCLRSDSFASAVESLPPEDSDRKESIS